MQVIVEVSRAELAEMEATEDQLKQSVTNALERGLEDEDGTVYLSGLDVIVTVAP